MTNSMLSALTPEGIAYIALIRESSFEVQVWIFVEGVSDYKCYKKFINQKVAKLEIAGNKPKALASLRHYLKNKKEKYAVAILDGDYDPLLEAVYEREVFLTDCCDLISQTFYTDRSLQYALDVVSDQAPSVSEVRDTVEEMLGNLGYVRLANHRHRLEISLCDITAKLAGKTIEEIVDSLFKMKKVNTDLSKECLLSLCKTERAGDCPVFLLLRGHDIGIAVSVFLKKKIKSGKNTSPTKIEDAMLAAYDSKDFTDTDMYKSISSWASEIGLDIFSV